MEKMFGMQKMENMTDHEFAKYLKAKDPNWTWDSISEFNRFIANGKVVAVVKYHNSYPIGRVIWIEIEKEKEKEKVVYELTAVETEPDDPCPECGTNLRAKTLGEGGGVECPNPKCSYWFCF